MMRAVFQHLKCAARHWAADRASTTGAALAFYCAFSLVPLLVILMAVAGWIIGSETASGQIGAQLTALFGPATARTLLAAVEHSQSGQGVASAALSIVTLLIGASTVLDFPFRRRAHRLPRRRSGR